nr:hypothetical protein [Bacilli bacterium]
MKKLQILVTLFIPFFVASCQGTVLSESSDTSITPSSTNEREETSTQISRETSTSEEESHLTSIVNKHNKCTIYHYAAKEATCEKYGYQEVWYCANHDEYYTSNPGGNEEEVISILPNNSETTSFIIPALGHDYGAWEIKENATCTDDGYKERICSRCNHKETEKIYATGHTWEDVTYTWNGTESCTATRVCHVDPTHIETETKASTYTVITDATCTEKGLGKYSVTFTNKNFEKQEIEQEIAAKGHSLSHHNAVPHTCTTDGNFEYYQCTVCHKNYSDIEATNELTSVIDAAPGHNLIHHDLVEATCTSTGTKAHDECSECGKLFIDEEEVSSEDLVLAQLDHNYGTPTYNWNSDYTKVTGSAVCSVCGEVLEETVDRASVEVDPDDSNILIYTSNAFTNSVFSVTSIHVDNTHTHAWGDVTYTWNGTGSCTASRVCTGDSSHIETETKNSSIISQTEATCLTDGSITYSVSFDNSAFETQTKVVVVEATDHDWSNVTYHWNDDYSKCTATRVCNNDNTHIETETVDSSSKITKTATCTSKGEHTYTAEFTNIAFDTKVVTVSDIDMISHNYEATVIAPTCTEQGYTTHTCSECGHSYTDNYVDATDHDFGEASYEWNSDYTELTATRVCNNDPTHIETETVGVTSEVTKEATCTTKGEHTYTSNGFTNLAFEAKVIVLEDIDALTHDWGEANYVWNADYSEVTATRICNNDNSHIETETVSTTHSTTLAPTETTTGIEHYVSNAFTNSAFEVVEKDVIIPELDHEHSYGVPTYTWNSDNSQCTATKECSCGDKITETVDTTNVITTAPTCLETGVRTYTATFTNTDFETQYILVDVAATGHSWTFTSFTFSDDGKTAVANFVCDNNNEHTKTETATVTSSVKTAATCSTIGVTTYTATYEEHSDTKDVADIPMISHTYSDSWSHDDTNHWHQCENCDAVTDVEEHTYEASVTAPTCTEQGYTTHTCSVCGYSYIDNYVAATGHNWTFTDFTFSDDGKTAVANFVCSNDNSHVKTETATVTSSVKVAATCSSKGTTTYTATYGEYSDSVDKEDIAIVATAHGWVGSNYWSDNVAYVNGEVCSYDSSHKQGGTAAYQTTATYGDSVDGSLSVLALATSDSSHSTDTYKDAFGDLNLFFSNTNSNKS